MKTSGVAIVLRKARGRRRDRQPAVISLYLP